MYEKEWEELINVHGIAVGTKFTHFNDEHKRHYEVAQVSEEELAFFASDDSEKQPIWFSAAGAYTMFSLEGNITKIWDTKFNKKFKEEQDSRYPHTCEYCGSKCWNGMNYDCSNSQCPTKR